MTSQMPKRPAAPKILEGWSFLVVDDEPDNLDVARRMLTKAGGSVHTAESGQQTLEMLKTVKPDVIISDLSMPEMDGWTLIEHIRSNPDLTNIPVIALTAHVLVEDRARAEAAGFVNYITKPLDVARFAGNVALILREIPSFRGRFTAF